MIKEQSGVGNDLGLLRLVLVLSSLSPVFILWAVRGSKSVESTVWVSACLVLFAVPNLVLWWLVGRARRLRIEQTVILKSSTDRREHLITYLFALLLPIYDANIGDHRELAAVLLALFFVGFLFWYMRLHYINVVFALFGYRLYEVEVERAAENSLPRSSIQKFAIISKKTTLAVGMPITLIRLGGSVFLDGNND